MTQNIAIIPARGGSKGVPRKNIKLLAGQPLIYYTIKAALDSKKIEMVYVSTEDLEIAEISKKIGAKIIHRPKELAEDNTVTIPVLLHAIDYVSNQKIAINNIILLQPTSPLRNSQDIDNAIDLIIRKKCKSVVSVCEFDHSPYWSFKLNNETLIPLFYEKVKYPHRQSLETLYRPNGAIYVAKPKIIKEYKGFFTDFTVPYTMSKKKSIDIDSMLDFEIAELILSKGK